MAPFLAVSIDQRLSRHFKGSSRADPSVSSCFESGLKNLAISIHGNGFPVFGINAGVRYLHDTKPHLFSCPTHIHMVPMVHYLIMISDSTIDLIRTFVRERDWDKYHAPGNLAKSVSIEAAELLECFQWNDQPCEDDLEHIHEEIADVMIYCIMLANKLGFDLDDIIRDKMQKNAKKYPVESCQ